MIRSLIKMFRASDGFATRSNDRYYMILSRMHTRLEDTSPDCRRMERELIITQNMLQWAREVIAVLAGRMRDLEKPVALRPSESKQLVSAKWS